MFSPYYAWRGRGDPEDHVAINVALYGRGARRWAMTERGRGSLDRSAIALSIGPSWLAWDGGVLVLTLDEVTAPLPRRVRGVIRFEPDVLTQTGFALDEAGRHIWRPIAPRGRVEVDMRAPELRWTGTAYLDSNRGSEPLEDGFRRWQWSRSHSPEGTTIIYDAEPRRGRAFSRCLRFGVDGAIDDLAMPAVRSLPKTPWGIARSTFAGRDEAPATARTLEDSPFYARSLVSGDWHGEPVAAIHESLDLDRFSQAWVRLLLPFRMPRRARRLWARRPAGNPRGRCPG